MTAYMIICERGQPLILGKIWAYKNKSEAERIAKIFFPTFPEYKIEQIEVSDA